MSARGDILAAIKFNRPSGQHVLPVVPRFAVPWADGDRIQVFTANLVSMGGQADGGGADRGSPCAATGALGNRLDCVLHST